MALALIIHGTPDREEYFDPAIPSPSNKHWLPWLQRQLQLEGYEAQTPEMPIAYRPDYKAWSREFERYSIGSDSLLVGHSCGGGFLLRWLSENAVAPRRVILVAPWLDPDRNHCAPGFFDFVIDGTLANRTDLHVLYTDNDASAVERSVQTIIEQIPKIKKHLFPGAGHFCGISEFKELREVAINGCV